MSDLFHRDIPDAFIDRVFDEMERTERHIFQVLTKRAERMKRYVNKRHRTAPCPAHVWLGVSVENIGCVWRAQMLRETNATVRWISAEPLLGSLACLDLDRIVWVVAGGESGPGARSMDPAWARELRDQCVSKGVAFFFKQWGGIVNKGGGDDAVLDGRRWLEYPASKTAPATNPPSIRTRPESLHAK
jgi:protein gp37